jgi:hypothetical protein
MLQYHVVRYASDSAKDRKNGRKKERLERLTMEMEQTRRTEETSAGLELNGSTRPRGRTLIWSWVHGVSSSSHANSPMEHKFATYSRELTRISARWRRMRTIEPCWSGSCIGSLREWQGLGTISSRTFDGGGAEATRRRAAPRSISQMQHGKPLSASAEAIATSIIIKRRVMVSFHFRGTRGMTSDAPFLHTDRDQAALAFGADPSDVDPSHHHPHPRPHPSLSHARHIHPWWRYVKNNPPAR